MIHYSSWGSLYLSERARERQPEGGSAAQAEGRAPTEVTTEPTTALLIFPPSLLLSPSPDAVDASSSPSLLARRPEWTTDWTNDVVHC